ncbi:2,3-bisphosphoglycerate-independent phosphoglycerate mutase [Salsipaludibacter albus]|uniref:2,3-bisphosphoglycerate-independent phosphoglycerate mutase n=1 Tax=Salsipaludibacter albus TaxID=2849650 RepID=UPI001EE45BCE|nr:2,3-bisphosphoglycerate-independent phosphoglycerate mutase [Salsipaludibacter albus]MBY5164176.1 2,3-bisphosphoglycerate-independent phosphoglycerate mutase [Salsipaludibacter albus]
MTVDLAPLLNDEPAHIVLLVMDGLGGFATAERGSELEEAHTPNLDRLATEGTCGLVLPTGPGITAGSGPGHLGLFGYDPTQYELGRGVLAAVGVGFPLEPGDVAARGNLALLDDAGNVTDRRAGRISDDRAVPLVDVLNERVAVDGAEVFFQHISEHRVLIVLRGDGLDARIPDLDPQRTGVPPKSPTARHPDAQRTADLLARVDDQVRAALEDQDADVLLMRGFDTLQDLPHMDELFGVTAATVARYPMYRGVASLVGMEVLPKPADRAAQVAAMRDHWDDFDYFFMHEKETDRAGHDGDWDDKVAAIEAIDALVPDIVDLGPDVLVVSGDHSSPTQLSGHSWHPVPTLMWGPRVGRDAVTSFGERACAGGLLGQRATNELMPIMLAAAGRLEKYGA